MSRRHNANASFRVTHTTKKKRRRNINSIYGPKTTAQRIAALILWMVWGICVQLPLMNVLTDCYFLHPAHTNCWIKKNVWQAQQELDWVCRTDSIRGRCMAWEFCLWISSYLNELYGDSRLSDTSAPNDDQFVGLCWASASWLVVPRHCFCWKICSGVMAVVCRNFIYKALEVHIKHPRTTRHFLTAQPQTDRARKYKNIYQNQMQVMKRMPSFEFYVNLSERTVMQLTYYEFRMRLTEIILFNDARPRY